MVEASHARPHAGTAVLPPSGPPVRTLGPALRSLPPSQQPPRPKSRRLRPLQPRQRRLWRRRWSEGPCSSPAPPNTVSLARTSMLVTTGEVSAILGWSDALLDFGSLLPTAQLRGRSNACEKGLGEAKHAGKEGVACMLMAPGPSSWAAGATESRRWWRAELLFDPELAPRVLGASWKVLRAARLQARAANALDSSPSPRDY